MIDLASSTSPSDMAGEMHCMVPSFVKASSRPTLRHEIIEALFVPSQASFYVRYMLDLTSMIAIRLRSHLLLPAL